MKKQNFESAKSAQSNAAQVASNSQVAEAAAKPRNLKCLANAESKLEMFSKARALSAVKTAFDVKESATREYLHNLGFSAQVIKSMEAADIDTKSKSCTRFSTWETLNALKRYAEAHDLKGEKAAKAAKEAERKAAAEARARMEEKKRVTAKQRTEAAAAAKKAADKAKARNAKRNK